VSPRHELLERLISDARAARARAQSIRAEAPSNAAATSDLLARVGTNLDQTAEERRIRWLIRYARACARHERELGSFDSGPR
jgi:hypothetical protein